MTKEISLDIKLLDKTHDRSAFDCGDETLNDYLLKRAGQELRRNIAFPYAMTLKGQNEVCGYYTLSASSVQANQLPAEIAKVTRYDYLPAVLIGRLALDKALQGKGVGQLLLVDALRRVSRSKDFAVMLVIVDAKDQKSEDFYKHFGFTKLDNKHRKLFIPFKSIKDL
jgi:predicted GNAT family N-acyltransferase